MSEGNERAVTEDLGFAPRHEVEQFLRTLDGDRCWKCKFFDPSEPVSATKTTVGDFSVVHYELDGRCRRNAPFPIVDDETEIGRAIWPWVDGEDWCGEFVECNRSVDDLTSNATAD